MARHLRIKYSGALYHVMARGNDRRSIFETIEDRKHLLDLLTEALERYEVNLYSYVFMTTHYHLVVRTKHPNLDEFMHYLNTAYTVWSNIRNQRTGHLFEGRYKAIVMENTGYLLSATAYIHLNPVRTQGWYTKSVEERMKKVKNYTWSSYSSYSNSKAKDNTPPISCDLVWAELGAKRKNIGIRLYKQYIKGWLKKEEKERRKPKQKRKDSIFNPFSDTKVGCYLGSDDFKYFIHNMISEDYELSNEVVGAATWRKSIPIKDLIKNIAVMLKLEPEVLLRRSKNNHARDTAIYLCYEVGQKKLREIGEFFGIKAAATSIAIKRINGNIANDIGINRRISKYKQELIKILKT